MDLSSSGSELKIWMNVTYSYTVRFCTKLNSLKTGFYSRSFLSIIKEIKQKKALSWIIEHLQINFFANKAYIGICCTPELLNNTLSCFNEISN
ncbi:hypothetical protein QW060_10295 [Myroides ceti]|uniref:Uncharacterized protein n=1 Tax=Paenimyroides ceti TaxID=395087 RepID=A0ABT8CU57_9FLAO|nr:hypothetical protein [Paenimyroides ceti]MDN3707521.1 hypothetical protein [Paenimyroides ceti]